MSTPSPRKTDQTRQPGLERPDLSTTEYNEPRVKETTSTKPPKQKQSTQPKQGVGGASSTAGSGAAAKLAKDEKKKQKAERRAQKKIETGKTGLTGSKTSSTSATGVAQSGGGEDSSKKDIIKGPSEQTKSLAKAQRLARDKSLSTTEDGRQVQLFSHLHQYDRSSSLTKTLNPGTIHPAIVRLGILYSHGVICGSNARCIAMLGVFKKVIQDYTTPQQKELSRDLEMSLKPYINFLKCSRPLSVSMGNAIKWLKFTITKIPPDTPEKEAKDHLCREIDDYIREKVTLADEAISASCRRGIIKNGDVILVYAHSSIVLKCLIDANKDGIKFKVIVVDSRPKLEGQHTLQCLVGAGIPCSYVYINAVSYIMKEVSKVILGAHTLLANGYIMSRVGSAMISLVAKSYNVPVLVCCETYKFSEKVQTDAFVINELGDPNDLVSINRRHGNFLSDWKDIPSLGLLNLSYDVTSPDLVAMVITEVGNIPCTSVPVILRLSQMNV